MTPQIVHGDLLDQKTEAIVNAWNRNIIPWWLLWPHGVSGAIKKCGGLQPFREVARYGPIPLGNAVLTGAGRLSFRGIIHVAGIDGLWLASEYSIRHSVTNAIRVAQENQFASLAFPVIGAGAGGFNEEKALGLMLDQMQQIDTSLTVVVVRYKPSLS